MVMAEKLCERRKAALPGEEWSRDTPRVLKTMPPKALHVKVFRISQEFRGLSSKTRHDLSPNLHRGGHDDLSGRAATSRALTGIGARRIGKSGVLALGRCLVSPQAVTPPSPRAPSRMTGTSWRLAGRGAEVVGSRPRVRSRSRPTREDVAPERVPARGPKRAPRVCRAWRRRRGCPWPAPAPRRLPSRIPTSG